MSEDLGAGHERTSIHGYTGTWVDLLINKISIYIC